MNKFGEQLGQIALAAGRAILDIYETDFDIEVKDDRSPVTEADGAAEKIILAGLRDVAPDIPVIAEERATAGHIPDIEDRFFLVDPLDGTREFIHRNGEFTVNIALVEHAKPVAGIVLAPAKDRMFVASGPGDCFEFSAPGSRSFDPQTGKKLETKAPDPAGLRVIASRSHRDPKTEKLLEDYNVLEIVSAGSSLKFCLIAAGEADFYPRLGRTMEWDTAAGHAVLAAAGGTVTNLDGSPFLYGKTERGYDNPGFLAWGHAPA